jgi:HK97 gp10 family phage protein
MAGVTWGVRKSAKTGRALGFTGTIKGTVPNLAKLGPEAAVKALPEVVIAVKEQAIREAPKKRGASSKKSIVSRIGGKVRQPGVEGVVWSNAPHSHLIEFGTAPHSLATGSGKSKSLRKSKVQKIFGNGNILRRLNSDVMQHPGSRANPFMERAIPNAAGKIERILQAAGDEAIKNNIVDAGKFLSGLKAVIT